MKRFKKIMLLILVFIILISAIFGIYRISYAERAEDII